MSDEQDKKRETFNRLRAELNRLDGIRARNRRDQGTGRAAASGGSDITREQLRQLVRKKSMPAREALSPPPPKKETAPAQPLRYSRDLPRHESPSSRPDPLPEDVVPLADAVPDGQEVESKAGRYFLVEKPTCQLEGAEDVSRAFRSAYEDPAHALHRRLAEVVDGELPSLEEVLFMDLETTGLSSSPLFLVGIMEWDEPRGLLVRQFLARNYAEEATVVRAFAERLRSTRLLVTFNGKSYDWPFVRMRAVTHAVPMADEAPPHLDLLHEGRRLWRQPLNLPDCKLQTLEWHVCERMRYGDIPGSQIPDAYHAFVRTGHATAMAQILKHNVFDLVTMADLMSRFPE